jgi:hypothetical protein
MEKRALGRSFCWFTVLVLPLVFILGVLPCGAEETYNLKDLIDNNKSIPVDNLTFSAFNCDYKNAHPKPDQTIPQPEDITVEAVGQGTTAPGLKFTPNFRLAVQPGPDTTYAFAKQIGLSYQVNAAEGSSLIAASTLILNPGTVEPEGEYAYISVQDQVGEIQNFVHRSKIWDTPSAAYMIKETLRLEANLSPTSAVSPRIFAALSVRSPGGEASIESFEQRFSLAPAPGAPIADAGPDLTVADVANLDGSKSDDSDGQIMSYVWKLKYRENSTFDREAKEPTPEVSNLEPGFYDVELTVTDDDGYTATDTMLLAASGPSGVGTEPEIQEAELNLWRFKLKKYKYCNWSIARMLGTFDLPDDFEFNSGDDLVGKVTIQVNRGEKPLVVMSDDIKLKVRKWKYKSEIRSY